MPPHIVCVGDVMVDVLARLSGPLAPGSDTPSHVSVRGGGAAANVAAWAVAAGAESTFVGCVGSDLAGRQAVADLAAAGVAVAMQVDPDRPTGTCIVLVEPGGERTMVPDAGANSGLRGPAADALPADADCLYLSGYALLNDGARPFALDALTVARDRGWAIAVDAASAAPVAAAGAVRFMDWIGGGVLLLANLDESLTLTELDEPAAAVQSLALRCGQAIVKRGAAGAVWSDGSGVRSTPAPAVEVVDSTGAGDAFAAGYLVRRLSGSDVGAALRAGAEQAARAVTRPGARPR